MAADTRTLKVEIIGDAKGGVNAFRQLDTAADQAQGRLGAASTKLDNFGRKAAGVGAKMSIGITAPLALFGKTAFAAASDLNESLSKSNTIFGQSAAAIEKWAATGAKSFGQSKQQALDAAGSFGNMFTQLGIAQGEAANMSQSMVELASDFASFHNADITEVLTAQSAAFRGEYDALQRFVPTINAAAVEEKALEMGLAATTGELTAQHKALATQALMLEGAGAAMGDFDRTADGAANKQRILKAQFQDTAAALGNQLMPIGQKILGWLGTLAAKFNQLSPGMQKVVLIGAGLLAVAGPLATVIGGLATVIAAMSLPVGLIVAGIAALVAGFIIAYKESETFRNFIDRLAATAMRVFGIIRDWVGDAVEAVSAFLVENRSTFERWWAKIQEVALAVADIFRSVFDIIAVVVTAGVAVITDLWDRFGSHLWGHIQTVFGAILSIIGGAFRVVQGIFDIFAGIFTGDWRRVWDGIKNVFGGVWDIMKGIVSGALGIISAVIGGVMATISAIWSGAWDGIKGVFLGVFEGIKAGMANAIGWILDRFVGALAALADAASHLPVIGKLFDGVGDRIRAMGDTAKASILGIPTNKNITISAEVLAGDANHPPYYIARPGAERRARGGLIPGSGDGDTVPAWLTPGEYVIRKSAVQAVGVDALEHLNAQGYATGGYIGVTGQIPGPGAMSTWHDALNDLIDKKAAASAAQYFRDNPVARGGSIGSGWQAITGYLSSVGEPYTITSTTGGRHAPGSYHYMGKAVDLVSGNMMRLFNVLTGIAGSLAELFYDPAGYSIKNGARVGWTVGGHRSHVHAATFDDGGWLQPGMTMAYNGTGSPERVSGPGGAGRIVIEVPVFLDGRELARGTAQFTLEELQKMADRGQRLFAPA